jgi:hypothetical protein
MGKGGEEGGGNVGQVGEVRGLVCPPLVLQRTEVVQGGHTGGVALHRTRMAVHTCTRQGFRVVHLKWVYRAGSEPWGNTSALFSSTTLFWWKGIYSMGSYI